MNVGGGNVVRGNDVEEAHDPVASRRHCQPLVHELTRIDVGKKPIRYLRPDIGTVKILIHVDPARASRRYDPLRGQQHYAAFRGNALLPVPGSPSRGRRATSVPSVGTSTSSSRSAVSTSTATS